MEGPTPLVGKGKGVSQEGNNGSGAYMSALLFIHKVLSVRTRQQRTQARDYVLMDDGRTIWPALESAARALADWAEVFFSLFNVLI